MTRALILGGTGLIGRAVARRLLVDGWDVDLTGRDPARLPADLAAGGARFHAVDRADGSGLAALVGAGADLLVDCLCFTAAHANDLIPLLGDVTSTAMLSSKAVYVDAAGHHVNSDDAPRFVGPISESQPTMAPGNGENQSRDGYGANKVAAEQTLLASGHPVTVNSSPRSRLTRAPASSTARTLTPRVHWTSPAPLRVTSAMSGARCSSMAARTGPCWGQRRGTRRPRSF